MLDMLIFALVMVAAVCAIAAWSNTRTIMQDLTAIKKELGMKSEAEKRSLLDRDLDED